MTDEAPDWARAIPNDPSIHVMPTLPGELGTIGLTLDQLETFVKNLIEGIIREVVLKIVGVLFPGPAGEQLAAWASGIIDQLDTIFGAFLNIDLTNPGGILAAITSAVAALGPALIQQILALLAGGAAVVGNPLGALLGVVNQGLQDIASLWAQLFGQQASAQAQIDAQASGGFSYDPALQGVTGWSNLVGTLALSSRGAFIQALTQTVAYRASGLSVDKYGVNFVIDPTMRGLAGAGICADSAGASWVGLLAYRGFDGDALWLVSGASPTLWVVQKQLDLTGVNRLSGLTTLDLKTDGVNKFSVKLNGQPVPALDWTDATGIATHNGTHRGVILLANGLNRNEDSFYGPAFRGKVVSYAA